MAILLVRHGETEWNLARRNQGHLDSPLTERGVNQARAIGRLLATLPEAAMAPIMASPLGRARRTAAIIRAETRNSAAVNVDPRLREHTLGAWDGLTYCEIEAIAPGLFRRFGPEWCFHSPDGESYADFASRLGEWLAEQDEAATIIAVAHGLVSRMLRGLYAGLAPIEALGLTVAQDRIFRLFGGTVATLAVQPEAAAAGERG